MPAGRRRKPKPQRARLQRFAALGTMALVVAAVVLPAAALDWTHSSADQPVARSARAADVQARLASRAADRASRDLVRALPVAARIAAAQQLATHAVPAAPAKLRTRWTTALLNVMAARSTSSRRLAVLPAATKVQVTGVVRGAWTQVWRGDRLAWVHGAYLSASKPAAKPKATPSVTAVNGSVSGKPCPDGSAVEAGLVTHTIEVYRAVCAAFPAVTTWGGRSGDGGDHGSGHALDIMCTGSLGDAIAAYVRAHASQLGVSYVIWSQHIWSVQRASEGWRAMPDRGSTTANHYDHVHVSVY